MRPNVKPQSKKPQTQSAPASSLAQDRAALEALIANLDALMAQQSAELQRLKLTVRRIQNAPRKSGGQWPRRMDWDAVDWKLRNAEIARQHGVTSQRVSQKRKELEASTARARRKGSKS